MVNSSFNIDAIIARARSLGSECKIIRKGDIVIIHTHHGTAAYGPHGKLDINIEPSEIIIIGNFIILEQLANKSKKCRHLYNIFVNDGRKRLLRTSKINYICYDVHKDDPTKVFLCLDTSTKTYYINNVGTCMSFKRNYTRFVPRFLYSVDDRGVDIVGIRGNYWSSYTGRISYDFKEVDLPDYMHR